MSSQKNINNPNIPKGCLISQILLPFLHTHSRLLGLSTWNTLQNIGFSPGRSIGAGLGKIEARVENDVLSDSDIQDE